MSGKEKRMNRDRIVRAFRARGTPAIVWPLGLPDRGRFCPGLISREWTAFWLGLVTMRRICTARPASADQNPVVVARTSERMVLRMKP